MSRGPEAVALDFSEQSDLTDWFWTGLIERIS
ncbi:hypothetical protein CHKEEEPN_0791 [Methylorubrum podarium]|jgi:hypothetical protein|nr:hypothetical protein CHKEEEPN_0791 [Methylorubrum podarium]